MGKMSRNKGARGEREILGILQPVVDSVWSEMRPGHAIPVLRRNYTQRFESKQYDIIGLPWAAVEVKRCENLSGIGSWWKQVLAATRPGQTPILIYRQNHGKWRVRMEPGKKAGAKVPTATADMLMELVPSSVDY